MSTPTVFFRILTDAGRKLGISTAGIEIFASLHALYGQSIQLHNLAKGLDLVPEEDRLGLFTANLHHSRDAVPKVCHH